MANFPKEGISQLRSEGWAVCEKRKGKYDPGRRDCLGKGLKVGSLRERREPVSIRHAASVSPATKWGERQASSGWLQLSHACFPPFPSSKAQEVSRYKGPPAHGSILGPGRSTGLGGFTHPTPASTPEPRPGSLASGRAGRLTGQRSQPWCQGAFVRHPPSQTKSRGLEGGAQAKATQRGESGP